MIQFRFEPISCRKSFKVQYLNKSSILFNPQTNHYISKGILVVIYDHVPINLPRWLKSSITNTLRSPSGPGSFLAYFLARFLLCLLNFCVSERSGKDFSSFFLAS